ncbi:MAG: hypothetical protein M1819_004313 [Sarea resinae]|nr:MAG: hypothetical protein M1819_004313 [Sarea resinae]
MAAASLDAAGADTGTAAGATAETEDGFSECAESPQPLTQLPFPPVTKSHILHCSYHYWHPRFRSVTPKARLIPLDDGFLSYLRADGIVLPAEDTTATSDSDSGIFSSASSTASAEEDEAPDPSEGFPEVHARIKEVIAELGGSVVPKLNWSAPKDATWIAATNSLDCRSPNDVYLLLKSSDFITHDLEHVFDDCVDDEEEKEGETTTPTTAINATQPAGQGPAIPYHLVLRKHVLINPSLEFRCFVRNNTLIGICQRDPNHFDFLPALLPTLQPLILDFFTRYLKSPASSSSPITAANNNTTSPSSSSAPPATSSSANKGFPDPSYAFDVYIPPPHTRVWLIDINPWAPRTDPLLFSWLELLSPEGPQPQARDSASRIPIEISSDSDSDSASASASEDGHHHHHQEDPPSPSQPQPQPEPAVVFRLIHADDPEAYSFSTPQYSAHKMPKDVVDAAADLAGGGSGAGGGGPLREFAERWREVLERRVGEGDDSGSE